MHSKTMHASTGSSVIFGNKCNKLIILKPKPKKNNVIGPLTNNIYPNEFN